MSAETCAPDCEERTLCVVVGRPGHWQCGWCDDHNESRHHCGCLVTGVQP